MFFLQAPYSHCCPCSSSMFSMAVNDMNSGPTSLSHNSSYMDCYESPSFKDFNISTLPCNHHVLPGNALYKTLKHIDDSIFFKKLQKPQEKRPKNNTSLHGTISLLITISVPTMSTHTPLFFKRIVVFTQTDFFSLPKLLCLHSPSGEWWRVHHSRSISKIFS